MSQALIHYDRLVQTALRGVVRETLAKVAVSGLPGEHHFYIAFRTDHPGVVIAQSLKSRYPNEMTIVLQNEFWNLDVKDQYFEVGLSFNRANEKLHIPFDAITSFFDPSVQFGMKFEVDVAAAPAEEANTATQLPKPTQAKEQEQRAEASSQTGEVVSLDSFRKKS